MSDKYLYFKNQININKSGNISFDITKYYNKIYYKIIYFNVNYSCNNEKCYVKQNAYFHYFLMRRHVNPIYATLTINEFIKYLVNISKYDNFEITK